MKDKIEQLYRNWENSGLTIEQGWEGSLRQYGDYIKSETLKEVEEKITFENERAKKEEGKDILYDYEYCRLIGRNQGKREILQALKVD